jgi:hypothetical protein
MTKVATIITIGLDIAKSVFQVHNPLFLRTGLLRLTL